MSGLTPAAPLAVFCSLPRKLLPVSTGSNMSSQPPYIRSLCPEFRKRLARTVLIFTERSDQLSR
ncbi:hypothetical protein, partial [Escherichia coli]|uniref:hypothetical protein n=1 Tax=Escherichia coli TaxID=562 RepID=UPI00207B3586